MTKEENRKGKIEQVSIEEFIKDLEHTAEQVQELLIEIRESKVNFAQIKTEIRFIVDNIKQLSAIVRGNGTAGSIVTRLAIVEQAVKEIKDYISEDTKDDAELMTRMALLEQKINNLSKSDSSDSKISAAEAAGKWKLYVTIAGGIFTLLSSVIALIVSLM